MVNEREGGVCEEQGSRSGKWSVQGQVKAEEGDAHLILLSADGVLIGRGGQGSDTHRGDPGGHGEEMAIHTPRKEGQPCPHLGLGFRPPGLETWVLLFQLPGCASPLLVPWTLTQGCACQGRKELW